MPPSPINFNDWITSREAAILMGCRVDYLHRLNYIGALHPVKVGPTCLYRRIEIERYIDTHPQLNKQRTAS